MFFFLVVVGVGIVGGVERVFSEKGTVDDITDERVSAGKREDYQEKCCVWGL